MLITLEGIEGSGKTSQIGFVLDYLRARGVDCFATREPGGTAIGAGIRTVLLDPANTDMAPYTEMLLYMADRAQHLHSVIGPALEAGRTVVCDRFMDATVVYQGYARGLDLDVIHQLHRRILGGVAPDLTLLLDLAPRVGLARAWRQIEKGERTDKETRFEKETLAFHDRIREGYLEMARLETERFRIVDAALPQSAVRDQIADILSVTLRSSRKPLVDTHSGEESTP